MLRVRGLFTFVALFLVATLLLPTNLFAQAQQNYKLGNSVNLLPVSQPISHSLLKGIKVNPDDPFDLEFIIDTNDDKDINKDAAQALIDYFFAGLTLPEKDLWVNLSPNEADRIIPDSTATTNLGQTFLEQDYLLKQLAASLTYPETEAGKAYWQAINDAVIASEAKQSFNRVWIVPSTAKIYENGNSAFITESSLKVEMQDDMGVGARFIAPETKTQNQGVMNHAPTESFKKYILPLIAQQVNEGEHFSQLRQIYNALILGVWFKQKLKDSIYKDYINKSKTTGIDKADKGVKEKTYQRYLEAFKRGAYDYTKTVTPLATPRGNAATGSHFALGARARLSRHYFSGGVSLPVSTVAGMTTQPPLISGHEKRVRARILPIDDKIAYAHELIQNDKPGQEYSDIEAMDHFLQRVNSLAPEDHEQQIYGAYVTYLTPSAALRHGEITQDRMPQGRVDVALINWPNTPAGFQMGLNFPAHEGFNYPLRNSAGEITGWKIVVFSNNPGTLAHELREVALRQLHPDLHWTEIHNMVCDELGTAEDKFTPEQIEQYKKEGQSEIGSSLKNWFGKKIPLSPEAAAAKYTENFPVEAYVDNIAFNALAELRHYASNNRIRQLPVRVFQTGVRVQVNDLDVWFSFIKYGAPYATVDSIYQLFGNAYVKAGFTAEDDAVDITRVAEYFLNMIDKDSEKFSAAQSMVAQIRKIFTIDGRNSPTGAAPAPAGVISPNREQEAAFTFFGLDYNTANDDQVRAAYARIIKLGNTHPDRGGATEDAARLGAKKALCHEYINLRSPGNGGGMGRWQWQGPAIIDWENLTATLPQATRIANKAGVVEEEFLIDSENKPRDITVNLREVPGNKQDEVTRIRAYLGIKDDIAIYQMEGDSVNKNRLIGLALTDRDGRKAMALRPEFFSRDFFTHKGEYDLETAHQVLAAGLWHEQIELDGTDSHDGIRYISSLTDPQGDKKLTAAIKRMTDSDKAAYGGINISQDTISLQTTGNGRDFKINVNANLDYAGLMPKVISINDLPRDEFTALLKR